MKNYLAITPLLLLTACASAPKEEEHKKPTVAVKTAVAEASTVELTLRAPATIFPREQANITPRITGAIRQLKARKGDTVAAGALLATQENRDLTALRDEAQAQLNDAQATLEKTRRGTNPTDTERARGQVETTQALLNQAQKIYDRRKALFDQGAIPQRDLLISETELATAKTHFNVATRSLKLLASESQTQDIRIAEARVEQAKSRLNNLTTQLQFADLRAPFSGTITEQFQYAGDLGQPSHLHPRRSGHRLRPRPGPRSRSRPPPTQPALRILQRRSHRQRPRHRHQPRRRPSPPYRRNLVRNRQTRQRTARQRLRHRILPNRQNRPSRPHPHHRPPTRRRHPQRNGPND